MLMYKSVQDWEVIMDQEDNFENRKEASSEKLADGSKLTHKAKCRRWIPIVIIILLLALLGICYLLNNSKHEKQIGDKTNQISQLEREKNELKKKLDKAKEDSTKSDKQANSSAPACKQPTDLAKQNIRDAISSGNTAAFEGYMASKVQVLLAMSDGIGERTPSQAISDIDSFLKNATAPWDINISSSTINPSQPYKKYFPDSAVVVRSKALVISFSFDCDGKISTIFMANDFTLLQ